MGARYLKAEEEEEEIVNHYSTASRAEMLERIPNRTWLQIGVHARHMRVLRTTTAWGNSIREGRKILKHSWSDADNERFDLLYPIHTYIQLLAAFPERSRKSIRSHAQKRHLHRTREAVGREISIGHRNARGEKKEKQE
jgi:hypothetical protein